VAVVVVVAVRALPTTDLSVVPEGITVVTVKPAKAQQVVVKLDKPMATETMTRYRLAEMVVITEPIMPGLVYTDLVPGHRPPETATVLLPAAEPADPLGHKDNTAVPVDW
jgi:hypothetical protein